MSAANTIAGQSTVLTGSASDPDGNLRWIHFYVNGPGMPGWNHVGSAPVGGGEATGSIDWTPTEAGVYTVHIRAQDTWDWYDWNGNVAANFSVSAANSPPQTNWVSGSDVIAGQPTTLTGNASDPDGNLHLIHFYVMGPGMPGWNPVGSVQVGGGNATGSINWTPSQEGVFTVHIRAQDTWGWYDGNGNVAASFSVSAANRAPKTESLTASQVTLGQAAIFTGRASDPDGNLAAIHFYVTGTGLPGWNYAGSQNVSGGDESCTINWTPAQTGSYTVHIRCQDTWGSFDWNGNIVASFTVIAAVDNTPPTAPSGLTATLVAANSFTFSWSASSDNVGVAAYAVTRNGLVLGEFDRTNVALSGLPENSSHAMSVRARDAAGNWSAWTSLQVQTSGSGALSGSQTAWWDVNGDGIRDEIVGAQSSRFSYYISAWSTYHHQYAGRVVNDFWIGRNTTWPNGDQNPSFSSVWAAEWYIYPSTVETQVYFDLNFNLITEPGYDYRLFMDTTGSIDTNPSNWAPLPSALGILNWPEGGYQRLSWPNVNADVVYGKRFFFARLGKPIGSLIVGGAASGVAKINAATSGTVTLPGLGTVSVSGFGRVLMGAGVSPVISLKDVLDKVIHAGPKVVWEVWDLVTNTKLNLGGFMTSLDLGVDLQGRFLVGAKLDDQSFLWFQLEIDRPPRPAMTVVSRDKFLAGSVTVPAGADQLEIEFLNTTSGESLGRYGSLLGGGDTKIYPTIPDILSDADVQAGGQPASQKVWFVKDPSDQRKLSFYTCFNAVGSVEIRLWKNGERIGGTTHDLVAAQDFADWIVYVDDWVKGSGFSFPGDGPSTATLTAGISDLSRPCLIPIFNVISQVEGLEAVARGLFDGARMGLDDDWKALMAIKNGAVDAGAWGWTRVETEIGLWHLSPVKRALELNRMVGMLCYEFVFIPQAQLAVELSTWEGFKNRAWVTWAGIHGVQAKGWTLTLAGGSRLKESLLAWGDDFADRMMLGGERASFLSTGWAGHERLSLDLVRTGGQMAYTFGYVCGYLTEQVVMGAATAGTLKFGQVLVKGGVRLASQLSTRTAFQFAAHAHLLKKTVSDAAVAGTLRAAMELGVVNAARMPVDAATKTCVVDVIENALARQGFDRASCNIKFLWDEVVDSTNLKKLCRTVGREEQALHRLAIYFQVMGVDATGQATKGWMRAYERLLRFSGDGFLEDRAGDFFAFFRRADGTTASSSARKSLEEYWAKLSSEGPGAKFWVRDFEQVADKLYHYSPSLDRLTGSSADGFKLSAHSTGRGWYVTPSKCVTRDEAASLLQLPDPANGRYRIRFSTIDVKENLKLPKGSGNTDSSGALEPLCRDFPDKGFGGGKQLLLENRAVLVDEVFDTVENRFLSSSEIQALVGP
ncbi:MAG TPA: hypothetical protein VHO24_09860 [Opitutaceae bacterium]|nr:hypothetical protein [Opitutaceae bacterium]